MSNDWVSQMTIAAGLTSRPGSALAKTMESKHFPDESWTVIKAAARLIELRKLNDRLSGFLAARDGRPIGDRKPLPSSTNLPGRRSGFPRSLGCQFAVEIFR